MTQISDLHLITAINFNVTQITDLDLIQFLHKAEQHGVDVIDANHWSLQHQPKELFGSSTHLKKANEMSWLFGLHTAGMT